VPTTRRQALVSTLGLAAAGLAGPRRLPGAEEPPPAAPAGPLPPVSLGDFEALARDRMSHLAFEYVTGGAADEITVRENRAAYDRIRLRPRVLVDVSRLDTRLSLLGQELPFPILLAPTAYHRLVHEEGELATVRGAGAAGATLVVSSFATTSVEEMSAAATGPLWFQLYVQPDRGFTRELVHRAEKAGCRALCVTVDTPVLGARNREQRLQFALPPGMERANFRGLEKAASAAERPNEQRIYSAVLDPSLTWREIEWLQSLTRVPLLLKGILNPEDARRAVETGVAGLIVSNHGGRNLDTVPATVEALPLVVEQAAGRVPVLVDGGVRRGTDVLKALALGARAVLIGRPYLYGLAARGAEGVTRVVNVLESEFEMAMALTGRPTLSSIDRSVLWPTGIEAGGR
jgi:4-hydroxymandelate oxidase